MHNNVLLTAPIHICNILLYSAELFAITSHVAYMKNYYMLSLLAWCVYYTSLLYWSYPISNGVSKKLDTTCSILLLVEETRIGYRYKLWILSLAMQLSMHYWNCKQYHTKITQTTKSLCTGSLWSYLFSNGYTIPDTKEREQIYWHGTIIHMLFCHIIPNLIACHILTNQ
jgi:hypothetical protein